MRENVGKGDGREKGESVTRGIRSLLHYIHL